MSCYCRDEVVLICPVCLRNSHSNTSARLCAYATRQHRTCLTRLSNYLMALWTPGTNKPSTEIRQSSRRRLRKALLGEKSVETYLRQVNKCSCERSYCVCSKHTTIETIPHLWPAGHSRPRKSWTSPSFHGCRSWYYDQDCVETKRSVQAVKEGTVNGRLRRELQCQKGSA